MVSESRRARSGDDWAIRRAARTFHVNARGHQTLKSMTVSDWIAGIAAFATLLAVLVALFGDEFWSRVKRPVLDLEMEPYQWGVRLKVHNAVGKAVARSVQVVVLDLQDQAVGAAELPRTVWEPIRRSGLPLRCADTEPVRTEVDVQPDFTRAFDLFTLSGPGEVTVHSDDLEAQRRLEEPPVARVATVPRPESLDLGRSAAKTAELASAVPSVADVAETPAQVRLAVIGDNFPATYFAVTVSYVAMCHPHHGVFKPTRWLGNFGIALRAGRQDPQPTLSW